MVPVTQGHEVSKRRAAAHDEYAHHILSEIEAGHPISQRSLASSLGIALGMTNLLLRRLVRKGWVRVSHIRPNRVAYFLTPTGIAEKARMSRAYFQHSVQYYASARDRVRASFADLSSQWSTVAASTSGASDRVQGKRIMFLGTGEVAEIAYVCLQETDLQLVGVVDFHGRERFFGVPVHPAGTFSADSLGHLGFEHLVVIAFSDTERIRMWLDRMDWPPERVFWL